MYSKNIEKLKENITLLQKEEGIKALLLFGCDNGIPSKADFEAILQLNSKPLLGGVFPEIIADGERKEIGFLIIPLYEEMEVLLFESETEESLSRQLKTSFEFLPDTQGSVFCFANAFWSLKTAFMNGLYNHLGHFVNYLGGGAGSLSFKSIPCIIYNQEIVKNAAVIGLIKSKVSIGVAHGWHPISDPIKVTKSIGNKILTLNFQPAFEVYKQYVEKHSNKKFSDDNFFEIAKSYPLGLVKLDDEMVVRDPYATENKALHIVDEVPEGEYIRIMHGDMSSLLKGAESAVMKSASEGSLDFTQLCIDCISRVLYMQDDFKQELDSLNKNQKANGILSIGEIANPRQSALELFNKTVVVAQWKKKN